MTLLGVNTCSYFTYWGLVAKFPFGEFFAKGTRERWVLSQLLTSPQPHRGHNPAPLSPLKTRSASSGAPLVQSQHCSSWRGCGDQTHQRQQQKDFLLPHISKKAKPSPGTLLRLILGGLPDAVPVQDLFQDKRGQVVPKGSHHST